MMRCLRTGEDCVFLTNLFENEGRPKIDVREDYEGACATGFEDSADRHQVVSCGLAASAIQRAASDLRNMPIPVSEGGC
jgi:hypothetical protein